MNREEWLTKATDLLSTLFDEPVPQVHVSTGWPSTLGTSTKKRRVGECWRPETSADGHSHIFISPVVADTMQVLGVLTHELIHAIYPEAKHKGKFVTEAKAVGLVPPWTGTSVGPELEPTLKAFAEQLGEYPHYALTPSLQRKVQTTRQLKVQCPACGYTLRVTRKWLDVAVPTCPNPDCKELQKEMTLE